MQLDFYVQRSSELGFKKLFSNGLGDLLIGIRVVGVAANRQEGKVKMSLDILVNAVFGIIGAIGTIAAFLFERRARRLARERFRFSWADVNLACKELSKSAIKKFKPDLLIVMPGGPAIVANLLLEHQQYFVPQICIPVGVVGQAGPQAHDLPGYTKIGTPDYELLMPASIVESPKSDCRVLIVEDAIRTNQPLIAITEFLVENGYAVEHIRSCALVATQPVLSSTIRPTWVQFEVTTSDFFLPWGKI